MLKHANTFQLGAIVYVQKKVSCLYKDLKFMQD